MDKQTIIDLLNKNYSSFIDYINNLSVEEFVFACQQKWSAGQQLEHIVLCVKPLVQVLSMDKLSIKQNFGLPNGPGRTYEMLLKDYKVKLKEGGKAPDRYVPGTILLDQREILSKALTKMIKDLCSKMENFTEQDLDTLSIPHPLLGNLAMREMLYNAIYHVEHHHQLTRQNLANNNG
jgi:hypothetical protein